MIERHEMEKCTNKLLRTPPPPLFIYTLIFLFVFHFFGNSQACERSSVSLGRFEITACQFERGRQGKPECLELCTITLLSIKQSCLILSFGNVCHCLQCLYHLRMIVCCICHCVYLSVCICKKDEILTILIVGWLIGVYYCMTLGQVVLNPELISIHFIKY